MNYNVAELPHLYLNGRKAKKNTNPEHLGVNLNKLCWNLTTKLKKFKFVILRFHMKIRQSTPQSSVKKFPDKIYEWPHLPVPRITIEFRVRHFLVVHRKRETLFVEFCLIKFLFVTGNRFVLRKWPYRPVLFEKTEERGRSRSTLKNISYVCLAIWQFVFKQLHNRINLKVDKMQRWPCWLWKGSWFFWNFNWLKLQI